MDSAGRMGPAETMAIGSLRCEPAPRYSSAKWEVRGACLAARSYWKRTASLASETVPGIMPDLRSR